MMSKTQNQSLNPVNLMTLNDLLESTKRTKPSPRRLKVVNPNLTAQLNASYSCSTIFEVEYISIVDVSLLILKMHKLFLHCFSVSQFSIQCRGELVFCLFPTAQCFLEKDSGRVCGSYMSRWYYSQQTKKCMRFWYGGCGGNENRFLTEDECFRECVSTGKFTKLCYSLIFRLFLIHFF